MRNVCNWLFAYFLLLWNVSFFSGCVSRLSSEHSRTVAVKHLENLTENSKTFPFYISALSQSQAVQSTTSRILNKLESNDLMVLSGPNPKVLMKSIAKTISQQKTKIKAKYLALWAVNFSSLFGEARRKNLDPLEVLRQAIKYIEEKSDDCFSVLYIDFEDAEHNKYLTKIVQEQISFIVYSNDASLSKTMGVNTITPDQIEPTIALKIAEILVRTAGYKKNGIFEPTALPPKAADILTRATLAFATNTTLVVDVYVNFLEKVADLQKDTLTDFEFAKAVADSLEQKGITALRINSFITSQKAMSYNTFVTQWLANPEFWKINQPTATAVAKLYQVLSNEQKVKMESLTERLNRALIETRVNVDQIVEDVTNFLKDPEYSEFLKEAVAAKLTEMLIDDASLLNTALVDKIATAVGKKVNIDLVVPKLGHINPTLANLPAAILNRIQQNTNQMLELAKALAKDIDNSSINADYAAKNLIDFATLKNSLDEKPHKFTSKGEFEFLIEKIQKQSMELKAQADGLLLVNYSTFKADYEQIAEKIVNGHKISILAMVTGFRAWLLESENRSVGNEQVLRRQKYDTWRLKIAGMESLLLKNRSLLELAARIDAIRQAHNKAKPAMGAALELKRFFIKARENNFSFTLVNGANITVDALEADWKLVLKLLEPYSQLIAHLQGLANDQLDLNDLKRNVQFSAITGIQDSAIPLRNKLENIQIKAPNNAETVYFQTLLKHFLDDLNEAAHDIDQSIQSIP